MTITETHRFKVGDFNCIAINDGYLTMGPSRIFFNGSTSDELAAALKKHNLAPQHLIIPCTILLVDTGTHRVLFDCGTGHVAEHPTLGHLAEGLAQENITLDSITHVLLTHGHFDHVAGVANDDNQPTFPNARYVMAQKEWQYATDAANNFGYTRTRLLAIQDRLDLIEPDADVVPGIRALATPGHTWHHLAVQVTSGDDMLVCTIDTIDHPLQGEHPTWGADWDYDRQQSTASRRRILALASDNNALVHGFHFPFPGLGHFKRVGDVWEWEALS
jgi:glyoxylase-like metal-dependent hydrolase (beta-lactamase superfamily II)